MNFRASEHEGLRGDLLGNLDIVVVAAQEGSGDWRRLAPVASEALRAANLPLMLAP